MNLKVIGGAVAVVLVGLSAIAGNTAEQQDLRVGGSASSTIRARTAETANTASTPTTVQATPPPATASPSTLPPSTRAVTTLAPSTLAPSTLAPSTLVVTTTVAPRATTPPPITFDRSSVATCSIGSTLRLGSAGTDVECLQGRLGQMAPGSSIAVDGDFGPATEALVRQAQEQLGLTADGIVGPQTAGEFGIWEPPAAPPPTNRQEIRPVVGSNCDASYPTVCIPSGPDLDCGDISHRRFTVLPPDPHGFDGNDNDGVGCESG